MYASEDADPINDESMERIPQAPQQRRRIMVGGGEELCWDYRFPVYTSSMQLTPSQVWYHVWRASVGSFTAFMKDPEQQYDACGHDPSELCKIFYYFFLYWM